VIKLRVGDRVVSLSGNTGIIQSIKGQQARVLWERPPFKDTPETWYPVAGLKRVHRPNDSYSPFAETERLHGGRADYRDPSEFDPVELARGTAHEMEHTDDLELAQEIARDHLAEDGAYYTHLDAMERGAFRSNASKTRYIGFCPVCERYIKCHHVRGHYVLVHHGYERPGEGYIVGDCFGVGHEPHEISPRLAQLYADTLRTMLAETQERLAELPRITKLTFTDYNRKTHTIDRSDRDWDRRFDEHKRGLEYRIQSIEADVRRMQRHVKTWEPLPLKTVQEEAEQVARQKRERSEQLASERAQKRADLIARTQARIDSAVRNQNMSALANIYESLLENYREKLKVATKQEVLEIIDRPHVWRAFGLMRGDEYLTPAWKNQDPALIAAEERLRHMQGWGKTPLPWPPELGEPKRRHKPNEFVHPNAGYYVWVLGADGYPLQTEGPHGPHDLQGAKTYARIAATEGRHDRAVSRGRDPETSSFEVVRVYRAGTGERAV
jgi:hypothetical protein